MSLALLLPGVRSVMEDIVGKFHPKGTCWGAGEVWSGGAGAALRNGKFEQLCVTVGSSGWDCGVLLCVVQVGNARQGIWGHRSTSDALRGR